MKNKITKGKDDLVEFDFTFEGEFETDGLNNFDDITVTIDTESYSSLSNPTLLYVSDSTTLILNIGDVTALAEGYYIPTIEARIESTNQDRVITSPEKDRLGNYVLVV